MRNLSYSAHEHDNATVHSTPRPSKFITSRHSVKSAAQTSPKKVTIYIFKNENKLFQV